MDSVYQTINEVMPDKGIMMEIAKTETREGLHPYTIRPGYSGGVFQVDRITFDDIQKRCLVKGSHYAKKRAMLLRKLGIDIASFQWKDLEDNPLLSGLFGRLKLTPFDEPIPDTQEGRAAYWKKYYNSEAENAKGTPQKYMDAQTSGFDRSIKVVPEEPTPVVSFSFLDKLKAFFGFS